LRPLHDYGTFSEASMIAREESVCRDRLPASCVHVVFAHDAWPFCQRNEPDISGGCPFTRGGGFV
jgi:hypothetical protein